MGPLAELPPGTMRLVEHEPFRVGVYNCGGELHAIEDRCSHDDGPALPRQLGRRGVHRRLPASRRQLRPRERARALAPGLPACARRSRFASRTGSCWSSLNAEPRPLLGDARPRSTSAYHDEEWGRPVRDERGVYERLCLEGFQSGLSWLTILRKRPAFREAFAGFDPDRVALFGAGGGRTAARRRRDRPPPRQDRGGDRERARDGGAARGRGAAARALLGPPPRARRRAARAWPTGTPRLPSRSRSPSTLRAGRLPVHRPDDRSTPPCKPAASSTTISRAAGCATTVERERRR